MPLCALTPQDCSLVLYNSVRQFPEDQVYSATVQYKGAPPCELLVSSADGGFLAIADSAGTALWVEPTPFKVLLDGGYSYPPYEAQTQVYAVRSGSVSANTAPNPLAWINALQLLPAACAVLAVGSDQSYADASAALYSTVSGNWTLTGPLLTGRTEFNLEALPDGTALMAGGVPPSLDGNAPALASAELFDPATNAWNATGSLTQPRSNGESALLPGGRVLVAGGQVAPAPSAMASAEVYSAGSKSWAPVGAMATPRVYHQMLALPNGDALVMGGQDGMQARMHLSFSMSPCVLLLAMLSSGHADGVTCMLWRAGRGEQLHGCCRGAQGQLYASAEVFHNASGSWNVTGSMAAERYLHRAALLPSGRVLVAGGIGLPPVTCANTTQCSQYVPLRSAEIYDPSTGNWTSAADMPASRFAFSMLALPSGEVLVAGGFSDPSPAAQQQADAIANSTLLYSEAGNSWTPSGSLVFPDADYWIGSSAALFP